MADATDTNAPQKTVLGNTLKLASEALVAPGTSLAVSGRVTAGLGHLAGAKVATKLIGPAGWLLVAANSYSLSTNGKGLFSELREVRSRRRAAAAAK